MNLGTMVHEAAARYPRKIAVVCGERRLTYEELDRESLGLARRLLAEGLKPGDRVGVHWGNSVETVKLLLACFHAGLVALPVNLRLKAAEVAYIMRHSGAAMWFSQPELAAVAQAARAETPGALEVRSELPAGIDAGELPVFDATQIGAVMYTSGTTARPKGVTHTHESLVATGKLMQGLGLDGDQTVLVMVTLMHASGMNCLLVPALTQGCTLVLMPAFDAASVLDTIERERCTYVIGLPAMLQFVVEEQAKQPRDLSSARVGLGGGDTVPLKLKERFAGLFGIPLGEVYGMTESVPATCNLGDAARPGSVGQPVDGVRMRVLDLAGNELPDGETGEVAIHSPANFVGYWNDEHNTAATLVDGWVLTGDLGRRDADGYYWFDGRKKEIIVRCGSNISPQEVEEALYQHPAVLEAGVIGMPHEVYGEQVVACVALREGKMAGEEELRAFARSRIADYKAPERIVFLPELPKGPTGKVQRRALKEQAGVASQARGA
jgi:long-chain acyl-CoA synthetase